MPVIVGAVPQDSSSAAPFVHSSSSRVLVVHEAAEVERARDLVGVGELLLEARSCSRARAAAAAAGRLNDEPDGERDHHDAARDADAPLVRAERLHPLGDPPPGEREDEQRQGGADGERHGEHDRLDADAPGRAGDGDRGEHRSGARHVDGAEREAEREPAALGAHVPPRDPRERLLEELLEARHDEADADEHEHDDARPAQHVLRQPEQRRAASEPTSVNER